MTGQSKLTVIPLTLPDACAAVDRWHGRHRRPQGRRFSLGVLDLNGDISLYDFVTLITGVTP